MAHLDDDTIALMALEEPIAGESAGHLAGCDACRAELDSFRHVVSMSRAVPGPQLMDDPPPAVWDAIVRQIAPEPVRLDAARARRLPARWLVLAACLAALLVGAGGALAWSAAVGSDRGQVIAAVTLEALPDHTGSGRAEVVSSGGERELEMTLDTDAPADTYLQVWLLSADASRMVPIGVLADSTGRWALPSGVTFADYPLVDVSIEPYDGDPLHSSNSVVRGAFDVGAASATGSLGGLGE